MNVVHSVLDLHDYDDDGDDVVVVVVHSSHSPSESVAFAYAVVLDNVFGPNFDGYMQNDDHLHMIASIVDHDHPHCDHDNSYVDYWIYLDTHKDHQHYIDH